MKRCSGANSWERDSCTNRPLPPSSKTTGRAGRTGRNSCGSYLPSSSGTAKLAWPEWACDSGFPKEGVGRPVKQVAQNYRSGELAVVDAPAPSCSRGGVLVRSLYSLISTGTELMKVGESKMSLAGKARARPDQVKKVLDTVQQQGPLNAYKKAMNRLDSY